MARKEKRRQNQKSDRRGSAVPRRRKSFLTVAGLVLASLAFAFVLGEIGVRLIYGPKYRPRAVFGMGDKHLGWKPGPNLDDTFYGPDYAIHIRTDADGYRLGSLGPVDYSKDLLVLLGDSYAFGWGVSTGETFASQLDVLVDHDSGGRMRLVNLGVGGYGVLQSLDRFEEFLRTHPTARVRAVIQQHCVNDGADNFRSLGYHLDQWEVEPVERPRSWSHLMNLIAYARKLSNKAAQSTAAKQARDADGPDMLWSYQRKGARVTLPEHVNLGGYLMYLDEAGIQNGLHGEGPPDQPALSTIQHATMAGTLNLMHEFCAKRDIPVVHTFITTTPQWYVNEVSALASASADESHCRVLITGTVPKEVAEQTVVKNAHSGGHFNAEFSGVWAQEFEKILSADHIVSR